MQKCYQLYELSREIKFTRKVSPNLRVMHSLLIVNDGLDPMEFQTELNFCALGDDGIFCFDRMRKVYSASSMCAREMVRELR